MAEHEAEMQRQMMSVPAPGTQVPSSLPPPPMQNINQNMMQQNNLLPPPPMGIPPLMHNNPNERIQQPPVQFNEQNENQTWGNDETDKSSSSHGLTPLMSVKVDKPDDVKGNNQINSSDVVLPKALEDVFAFKDQLADELGRVDGELPIEVDKTAPRPLTGVISTDYADADAESDEEDEVSDTQAAKSKGQHRLDKNKKKKQRKKQNKKNRQNKAQQNDEKITNGDEKSTNEEKTSNGVDDVAIEYVPEKITVADLAPMYRQFYRVFELFKLDEKPVATKTEETTEQNEDAQKKDRDRLLDDDDEDMDDDQKDDEREKLSKRKLKKLTRLSVAELKQLVGRPDVVEMHDVTARDPKLLVQLKAHRNTVQVPRHWCFKRKYLQGKRGIEKPPFDLPAFIKKTGIMEMRASLQEKDEAKTLKAKMRERTRPKMGKIDIDYQKLHDAFFK